MSSPNQVLRLLIWNRFAPCKAVPSSDRSRYRACPLWQRSRVSYFNPRWTYTLQFRPVLPQNAHLLTAQLGYQNPSPSWAHWIRELVEKRPWLWLQHHMYSHISYRFCNPCITSPRFLSNYSHDWLILACRLQRPLAKWRPGSESCWKTLGWV